MQSVITLFWHKQFFSIMSLSISFICLFAFFSAIVNKITITNADGDIFNEVLLQKDTLNWIKSVQGESDRSPYCRMCCIIITADTLGKNCGSHTLCKYPNNSVGPACHGYIKIRFTNAEKKALLDAHNSIRNIVAKGQIDPQPYASNMRAMSWNHELEEIADRWASQCIYNNDECRDLEKYPVGQNIGQGVFATSNELTYVKNWFNEVNYFNYSDIPKYRLPSVNSQKARRYTQLVWADTFQLGCARAIFQENINHKITYKENIVCNYGPAGNIPNLPVYKVGIPCSECPDGTTCGVKYDSLCEENSIKSLQIPLRSVEGYINKISDGHIHTINLINLYIFLILTLA